MGLGRPVTEQEKRDGSVAEIVRDHIRIKFQSGPIQEAGQNGAQVEEVIDILLQRLQGFQKGRFTCRENANAITSLEVARMWLEARTKDRVAREVEGTDQL